MRYQVLFFDNDFHHEFVKEFSSLSSAKSCCVRSSKSRILSGKSHFSIYCYKGNGIYSHSYLCDKDTFEFSRSF